MAKKKRPSKASARRTGAQGGRSRPSMKKNRRRSPQPGRLAGKKKK